MKQQGPQTPGWNKSPADGVNLPLPSVGCQRCQSLNDDGSELQKAQQAQVAVTQPDIHNTSPNVRAPLPVMCCADAQLNWQSTQTCKSSMSDQPTRRNLSRESFLVNRSVKEDPLQRHRPRVAFDIEVMQSPQVCKQSSSVMSVEQQASTKLPKARLADFPSRSASTTSPISFSPNAVQDPRSLLEAAERLPLK